MKIAIASVSHETNTYCSKPTPLESFRIRRRGDPELEKRNEFVKPLLDEAERLGATLVNVYSAGYMPSGTIEAAAWQTMKSDLLQDLKAELPVDGVILALHGAGVVAGEDDLEGDLAAAVRELVGPDVPITGFFDLHGNATQRMADALDATLPCHEYPHVDLLERGVEALQLIARIRAGEVRPVTHVETLPMLMQPSDTFVGPMKKVNELCAEIEKRPGVIECGLFHGFPYADTPLVGLHIIATTDGDRDQARAIAHEVGTYIWENRESFRQRSLTSAEAIAQALAVEGLPVVINETSDNPGGGAPGDGTHLLRALLDAKLEVPVCFGFVFDPEVVEQATKAGVGQTIDVRLGGKTDELHGAPLEVSAYVKSLTDGKYVGRDRYKFPGELGKTARLVIGGIDVVVTDKPGQVTDSGVFLLHGIDVDAYKIVALKSSNHFRAGFQDRARAIITADAPGLTTINIEVFDRVRTPRPIWPLDADAAWAPGSARAELTPA